jgi:hypothetical protein
MSEVRSCHPYAYHSGEWARIVTTDEAFGRPAWLLAWPNGDTDVWPQDDPPAQYEFRSAGNGEGEEG